MHDGMIVSGAQAGNSPDLVDADSLAVDRVTVSVPARLHIGFVDLNGGLGRRFGSLGIALDAPQTRLSVRRSEALSAEGPGVARALAYLRTLVEHFHLDDRLHLAVEAAIPEHVGLGSGTQLSLAIGVACCRLNGIGADVRQIAQLLERGARSSIGIATFEQGGVVLDGGRGGTDRPPPVLSRLPFPDPWRILLIFDNSRRGLHGTAEIEAFRRLPAFPATTAAHLCRLTLMVALPALAERDLEQFGGAIAELQRVVGDYFAPVQGARFMSAGVAEVLHWLESEGVRGVGQSSWGPTGFAIIGSEAEAVRLCRQAERRWPASSGLSFAVSRGRNRGGEVRVFPAAS
jgi:beta-RFAP synthase